jgi:hypothetical protein
MDLSRLKRFDKAKHEQLQGLLEWCQLMGLTGKDLVSLGGHIDRSQAAAEAKRNRSLADTIKFDVVGSDTEMSSRWSFKTAEGVRYTFENASWKRVNVTSNKTKVRKVFHMEHYDLGRISWTRRDRLQCALNIINGNIVLNF